MFGHLFVAQFGPESYQDQHCNDFGLCGRLCGFEGQARISKVGDGRETSILEDFIIPTEMTHLYKIFKRF